MDWEAGFHINPSVFRRCSVGTGSYGLTDIIGAQYSIYGIYGWEFRVCRLNQSTLDRVQCEDQNGNPITGQTQLPHFYDGQNDAQLAGRVNVHYLG